MQRKDWFPTTTSIFSCHDQIKGSQSWFWNLWNFQTGRNRGQKRHRKCCRESFIKIDNRFNIWHHTNWWLLPDESSLSIASIPWYANIDNFLQDFCQLIWIPKTKESIWATCRTFIGMTLTYSNIVLIKYIIDIFHLW